MTVSVRSGLTAGLAAGLVAGLVAAPTAAGSASASAGAAPSRIARIAVDLTASVQAAATDVTFPAVNYTAGELVIKAYDTVQPWVSYGVQLATWAAGFVVDFLPWPINMLGAQPAVIYSGLQPFAQSVAYSLAYLLDGQFDLVVPTLTQGLQTAVSALVQGELQWVSSFLPLPPLPSIAAAAPRAAAASRAAASVRAAAAQAPEASRSTVNAPRRGAVPADSAASPARKASPDTATGRRAAAVGRKAA